MNGSKIVTLFLSIWMGVNPAFAKEEKRKPQSIAAPPQYVILAFDGSLSNDFWRESQEFADTVTTEGVDGNKTKVKFTYFVNPPYYLEPARKANYVTPGINKTVSCIGWSKPENSIPTRVSLTNQAFRKGHEIGSHANSHCDQTGKDRSNPLFGYRWGLNEWKSEFAQFNKIFFNVYGINKIKPPAQGPANGFDFTQKDIIGFRAPLLGHTPEMWPALAQSGFKYDTSKSSEPTYWPQRHPTGIWNFPLGVIKIAGTNRTTYSMDYNFMCFQTACNSISERISDAEFLRLKNQMLDSYKYYFKINYFGGRGPVHIGHHFSKWNRGAYWTAMKEFAQFVCNKPGVRCVTYREYMGWLENLERNDPNLLKAYRAGQFNRLPDDRTIKNISTPILADIRMDETPEGFSATPHLETEDRMEAMGWKRRLSVNLQPVGGEGASISREELVKMVGLGQKAIVRASIVNSQDIEIATSTYRVFKVGTPQQYSEGPVEEKALEGESIEAHTMPE